MGFWEQFIAYLTPPEQVRTYRRVEYVGSVSPGNAAGEKNLDRTFNFSGDHLTIMTVTGGMPVYVRLGGDDNPFIPVREGMVLCRPFKQITFRSGNARSRNALAGVLAAKVVCYASFGPLVAKFPPKSFGMRRMPLMRYGLTATTASTELGSLLRASGDSVGFPTLGKHGGTLTITNTDASNDLYIVPITSYAQTLASGTNGYGPLRPGASVSLLLEDAIFANSDNPDGGGLVVKTLSGTCQYSVICSSGEMDDAEGEQTNEHVPGLR